MGRIVISLDAGTEGPVKKKKRGGGGGGRDELDCTQRVFGSGTFVWKRNQAFWCRVQQVEWKRNDLDDIQRCGSKWSGGNKRELRNPIKEPRCNLVFCFSLMRFRPIAFASSPSLLFLLIRAVLAIFRPPPKPLRRFICWNTCAAAEGLKLRQNLTTRPHQKPAMSNLLSWDSSKRPLKFPSSAPPAYLAIQALSTQTDEEDPFPGIQSNNIGAIALGNLSRIIVNWWNCPGKTSPVETIIFFNKTFPLDV